MHPPVTTELPLVGREHECAALQRAIDDARHGRTTIVHLIGAAGLGKSRLVAEACRLAEDSGALVFAGAASDPAGLSPFAAVRSPFELMRESRGERGLGHHLGLTKDDLALVLGPDSSDNAEQGVRRWREVLRRALTHMAARGPVLAVFDDVHWSDEQSRDVLASLARRPPPAGFVLVLAYRWRQELGPLLAATSVDVASTPGFSVRRLELAALGAGDLEALLPQTGSTWRQALLDATGGNPFFVQALLRHPMSPGLPWDESATMPSSVQAVLAAELDRLDLPDRRTVDVAAVLGGGFDPHLVADVLGQPLDTTLASLERARDEGICAADPGATSWRFRHRLLQVAAYEAQPVATRTATHRRVHAVMTSHGASLPERARHVAATARHGDDSSARLLVDAAREVIDRSPAVAERWLTTALQICADAGVADVRDVRLARCRANTALGRLQDARAEAHLVLGSLPPGDDRRVGAVRVAAHLDQLLGSHHESDALLTRELDAASNTETDVVALLVDLATTRLMRGDFEQARVPAEHAVALASAVTASATHGLVAASLALHALVALTDGAHARAVTDREAARVAVDALTDVELSRHLEAGLWLGWAEMFLEQYAAATRHLSRCLDIARRGTHQHLLTHLLVGYGSVLKLRGDLPGAAEAYDEAAAVARRTESRELLGMAQAMQCRAATWLGDHDRARHLGGHAVAATSEQGSWFEAVAKAVLAQARLVGGDARGVVDAVLAAGGGGGMPRFDPATRCDWWQVATQAAVVEGDLALARRLAEQAEVTAETLQLHAPKGAAGLARAQVALAGDRGDVAVSAARAAAAEFAAIGNRLEEGRARLLAGTALEAMGDRQHALVEVQAAEEAFAACSAAHLQALSRALMRKLGRRVPSPRRRSGPAGPAPATLDAGPMSAALTTLSLREWEVAQLVSAGYTNRQIAVELVLSQKTVESHLSHIFTKLGVTSRSAVAAAVAGVGQVAPLP